MHTRRSAIWFAVLWLQSPWMEEKASTYIRREERRCARAHSSAHGFAWKSLKDGWPWGREHTSVVGWEQASMVDTGRVDGTRTRTLVWCWLLCLLPHTRARLSSKDLRTVYEQDMWEDFFSESRSYGPQNSPLNHIQMWNEQKAHYRELWSCKNHFCLFERVRNNWSFSADFVEEMGKMMIRTGGKKERRRRSLLQFTILLSVVQEREEV